MSNSDGLVTAAELDARRILKRATAYWMARSGLIPCYRIGRRRRGIRFRVEEVLEALRVGETRSA